MSTVSGALRLPLLTLFQQAQTAWGFFWCEISLPFATAAAIPYNPFLIFRKAIAKRHKCSKEYNMHSQRKSNNLNPWDWGIHSFDVAHSFLTSTFLFFFFLFWDK